MTIRPSPSWVVTPVGADGAAAALGISRRTLDEFLRGFPYYERRGKKRVFYPEHIELLRKEMNQCASRSSGLKVGHMSTGQALMASGSDALSRLATLAKRKKPVRS